MSMDIKKRCLLLVAIPLFVAGCGNREEPKKSPIQSPSVEVGAIVPVRALNSTGSGERLLVPVSAIFHKGELTGVFVVGADNRLSVRWISTGRSMNNDLVVLGGLDKGELVVGVYSPALVEGVTVKKRVTVEDQTNE